MSFNVDKLNILYETPVEYLSRISGELGVEFYIKRDDLTPLGAGGNKLRKLEYLVKDAINKGATMLITVGGGQTNHGRQTAAMAAKYGMKCAILAVDEYPGELSANMLLDRLFGCELYLK
ncbi:MAG: pyridoxal-phosphate dependent enzyme, partial [Firmicutes bacterium]|nr:pyridoxal-phosphate dependent enzyme [Bacillota bacterium]